MTASTVLKWHGGKQYLADWIISHFPPHLHYVEPCFGGGSVFFAKGAELVEGHSEVICDLHGGLINFWRALQQPQAFELFLRHVEATPFSEYEWSYSGVERVESDVIDPRAAAAFFVRCRQSMAGRFDSFAPLTRNRVRRGMNEQASAWWSAVAGLPAVHARLGRVAVLMPKTAVKTIRQQDGEKTLFYLDPPYLHSTRSTTGEYEHEMADKQHADLLDVLSGIKGKFILSGYPSELYAAAEKRHGWNRDSREIDNKAASGKRKKKEIECLWMNF